MIKKLKTLDLFLTGLEPVEHLTGNMGTVTATVINTNTTLVMDMAMRKTNKGQVKLIVTHKFFSK